MKSSAIGVILAAVALQLGTAPGARGQTTPTEEASRSTMLLWQSLPELPNPRGVAGAYVGVSAGALVVAGGTNFGDPLWESDKQWHDRVHVLTRRTHRYEWHDGGKLPRPLAHGASVTIPAGLLCVGGCDESEAFADVHLLRWNPGRQELEVDEYPPLPEPLAYAQGVLIDQLVYVVGGQSGIGLDSAHAQVWQLDLGQRGTEDFAWKRLDDFPGPPRAMHMVTAQRYRDEICLYVMGGRREVEGEVEFLTDTWQFTPSTGDWQQRADMPRPAMAAPAIGPPPLAGTRETIFLLGGDDGSLFGRADELRDDHPGFPREALAYDTNRDTWQSAGPMPASQLATPAVIWEDRIVVASGETRPRVRTPQVWRVRVRSATGGPR